MLRLFCILSCSLSDLTSLSEVRAGEKKTHTGLKLEVLETSHFRQKPAPKTFHCSPLRVAGGSPAEPRAVMASVQHGPALAIVARAPVTCAAEHIT